jgi:inosine-uridine nucleoside N-ribohydrolase
VTRLIRERLGPIFDREPGLTMLMFDQVTVASLVDPSLVTSTDLYVDVDATHGLDYGTSIGGRALWPGAEGAQKMPVQHGLDWDRFIRMFVERVTRPVPKQ